MNQYSRQNTNPNPNTVLVVFLVLFVLLSIGLGVWGYLGFAGQDELLQKLNTKQKLEVDTAKEGKDYFTFVSLEVRAAIGDTLTPDELANWHVQREEFFKVGGNFSQEPTHAAVEKLIEDLKKQLGYNDAAKKYEFSYKERIAKLKTDLGKSQADKMAALADFFQVTRTQQNNDRKFKDAMKELADRIDKGDKDRAAAFAVPFDALEKAQALAHESEQKLTEANNKIVDMGLERDRLLTKIVQLTDRAAAVKTETGKEEEKVAAIKADASKHALILDVSTGKTMWDESLGRITSVDGKKVTINLGSAEGVRAGLTFNVFATKFDHSKSGRGANPSGELKGTIEVLRNVQKHTAEAIITQQFDAKHNPIKEDDLLFNMFWDTHVVVAGQINWFGLIGTRAENVADQVRNLDQFRALLKTQGVIVDAYVDLTDGSIKGTVTKQARFLIRGKPLYLPKYISPGDSKAHQKLEELEHNRIAAINKSIQELRADCVAEGLFVISAENFAHVTGIHKFRATGGPSEIGFAPRQPASGE